MSDAATFCATLVDEWCRRGVVDAVIAPGSRSTPMALAIAARDDLRLHVVHDERVAAFVALGLGLSGSPALLLCTSGTAAANFAPAVVEAGLSQVPMLVLTADRPPELRDVGAAQTIDQTHLFGRAVRWFHDPGIPDAAASSSWRSLARRAHTAAADGPVHLNLPFREPLVGDPGPLPPALAEASALWQRTGSGLTADRSDPLPAGLESAGPLPVGPEPAGLDTARGVIVAGGRSGVDAADVARLADATGWPVLADATSPARRLAGAVTTFDSLLRHQGFADAHAPEVIVRVGRPPASRFLAEWIVRSGAAVVQVGGPGTIDPDHRSIVTTDIDAVLAASWTGATGTPWAARWRHADERARAAIDDVIDAQRTLTEPGVARAFVRTVTDAVERAVVASSMPVRDVEWYGGPGAPVHANRGANGIDGTLSTALGLALGGRSAAVLVGDIAFVHDSNALTGLPARNVDLRIVVVDNDGGGIFSFLPQAASLAPDRFEGLFGTPHGTDVEALARAHGVDACTVATRAALDEALRRPGPRVIRVGTDRADNVRVHRELTAAVLATLDERP